MTTPENSSLGTGTSAARPAGEATRTQSGSENTEGPAGPLAEIGVPGPGSTAVAAGSVPRIRKTLQRPGPARDPGSAAALKMLTLRPVFVTAVPRHHIEPRTADGSRLVHDRATSELVVVYSPRFIDQFRAGHHAGLWYLRAKADVAATPRSAGFATPGAAIEAVRAGQWGLGRSRVEHERAGKHFRVIWS
jgi:hypothetical protein